MIPTILDTATGEKRKGEDRSAYFWAEGNGSCDCDRATYFGEEIEDELDNKMMAENPSLKTWQSVCYGCERFLIISVDGDTEQYAIGEFNSGYQKDLVEKYIGRT